jgi:hypothetical protein
VIVWLNFLGPNDSKGQDCAAVVCSVVGPAKPWERQVWARLTAEWAGGAGPNAPVESYRVLSISSDEP